MSTRSPTGDGRRAATPAQSSEAISDAEIVARCARGDAAAWEALVQRYRRLIYAIPHRMGLDATDADDVFQITFAKLAERVDSLEQPAQVRAWLVTTARRESLKVVKRPAAGSTKSEQLSQVADPAELPSEELERLQDRHLVQRSLAGLDCRCRDLLTRLYSVEGSGDGKVTYESVAKELGVPVGSVGPTRIRCLHKLLSEFRRLAEET